MKRQEEKMLISPLVFIATFVALLLFSGLHAGLVVLLQTLHAPDFVSVNVPLLYWAAVSGGLTLAIRHQIKTSYELPARRLAEAARKVANGDFSVYVPTSHTSDRLDYFDRLILDFNRMVEELGSIETLKTDFFSDVSHEIKTPLAVIHSNAELLECGSLTKEEQSECIGAIRDATRRLSGLISNMLKLNRLEKQVIQVQPEEYDLCAQLIECALLFEDTWDRKGIEFEAEIEDRRPITADPGLLELVWTNLLSNAVKFTPEGGSVTLRESAEGEWISVSVSDTGCGMDAETIRHIYDKFYQGDTSHATEGTGLGLALVHRVLELVGGSISVESEPGAGSTFLVSVPGGSAEKEVDRA